MKERVVHVQSPPVESVEVECGTACPSRTIACRALAVLVVAASVYGAGIATGAAVERTDPCAALALHKGHMKERKAGAGYDIASMVRVEIMSNILFPDPLRPPLLFQLPPNVFSVAQVMWRMPSLSP